MCPGRTVGPFGVGHRLEGIADRHDAGAERNLLARHAVGVAEAVPAFVAGADQPSDRSERGGTEEDPLADDRVATDEGPFVVVQRSGLVEYLVRDRRLADVVQLGGADDLVDLLVVQAHCAGGVSGQVGDLAAMVAELGLALGQQPHQDARAL